MPHVLQHIQQHEHSSKRELLDLESLNDSNVDRKQDNKEIGVVTRVGMMQAPW
jgi:hypothetical protein